MAFISKELKKRSLCTGLLLAISTFLLNAQFNVQSNIISLGAGGVIPIAGSQALMQLMTPFLPYIKELHESGVKGEKELHKITRELALLIATLEAIVKQASPVQLFAQLGSTFALYETSEQFKKRGLGNGTTHLFIMQLLRDAFSQSRTLLTEMTVTQLLSLSGTLLPIIPLTLCYYRHEIPLKIVSNTDITQTTHEITPSISITLKSRAKHVNQLPIRAAAAGTMPIMHALSLFMLTGLDFSWLLLFGALLITLYLLETIQVMNTHEIAKKLKQLNIYIEHIRPGSDTKQFLNKILKHAMTLGIPMVLFMGLYPFIAFKGTFASWALGLPFLICETKNIAHQARAYNLAYSEGSILNGITNN